MGLPLTQSIPIGFDTSILLSQYAALHLNHISKTLEVVIIK